MRADSNLDLGNGSVQSHRIKNTFVMRHLCDTPLSRGRQNH